MVLTLEKNTNKLSATLKNNDKVEVYECTLIICHNPTCTCGIITLRIVPSQNKDNPGETETFSVDIDVNNKSLGDDSKSKVRPKDMQFARRFVYQLDEDDFIILYKIYYAHKNKITEESLPEKINANFQYDEIEKEGLMFAYNDILPYGETLPVTLNGMECVIFDQHCLKPDCSCTEAILNIFPAEEENKNDKELFVCSVNYKKKKWETVESLTSDLNLSTIKTAVELQVPDIYDKLKKRHLRLKAIYAYNKKKNHTPKQNLQLPKVGRNNPCPCGSGKKYKKCCLV